MDDDKSAFIAICNVNESGGIRNGAVVAQRNIVAGFVLSSAVMSWYAYLTTTEG